MRRFRSEHGTNTFAVTLEDIVCRDKGMDSAVLIELSVWGGAQVLYLLYLIYWYKSTNTDAALALPVAARS